MPTFRPSLVAVLLLWGSSVVFSQTPLRSMPGPQGGSIIYGTVDGANTPPAAMGFILKRLHNKYGERPVVGRVLKFAEPTPTPSSSPSHPTSPP